MGGKKVWGLGQLKWPDYVGYEVSTWVNEGGARVSGVELEAQQQMDPFVPS
jgi:hypothetical protein